jgi:hypothetical protein
MEAFLDAMLQEIDSHETNNDVDRALSMKPCGVSMPIASRSIVLRLISVTSVSSSVISLSVQTE